MNCIDCSYSLIKDGHSKCTYEEGECIKISLLEKENAELKAQINTLEVYLEGAINYLILDGDVDNYIIDCAERILHTSFNRSPNAPTVYQKLTLKEKRIVELEKENLELKEEMKAKQVVLNDFKSRVETVTDRFDKKSSQLVKAREILQEYIRINILPPIERNFDDEVKLFNKAEQFLEEVS